MLYRGKILKIKEGGKKAKVKWIRGRISDNLLVVHFYGEASNIDIDENSMCWVLCPMGDESNAIVIPYNVALQPTLEATEKAIGNFKQGNKITFKANGDIEIITNGDSSLFDITGNLEVSGSANIVSDVNTDSSYKVNDVQVVTSQQPTIANPTGGAVIDVEARASIVLILTALKTHGLIVTGKQY